MLRSKKKNNFPVFPYYSFPAIFLHSSSSVTDSLSNLSSSSAYSEVLCFICPVWYHPAASSFSVYCGFESDSWDVCDDQHWCPSQFLFLLPVGRTQISLIHTCPRGLQVALKSKNCWSGLHRHAVREMCSSSEHRLSVAENHWQQCPSEGHQKGTVRIFLIFQLWSVL